MLVGQHLSIFCLCNSVTELLLPSLHVFQCHALSQGECLYRSVHAFIWRWQDIKVQGLPSFHTDLELMGISADQLHALRISTTCSYAFMFLYMMLDEVESFCCIEKFVKRCMYYVEPDTCPYDNAAVRSSSSCAAMKDQGSLVATRSAMFWTLRR